MREKQFTQTAGSFQQHLHFEELLRQKGYIRLTTVHQETWWEKGEYPPYKQLWLAFPAGNRALFRSPYHLYPFDELLVSHKYRGYPVKTWCRAARYESAGLTPL